jgi:sugar O-acyltransferase (sialic acid O-acetyltransferase NeuD family)
MIKSLFGFGGHAREVKAQIGKDLVFFVDDKYKSELALPFSQFDPEKYEIMIAIGNSLDREKTAKRFPENTNFFSFTHSSSLIMDQDVKIGSGSFIGANCILTINIILGDHALLNRGNQIGHDCRIGDFFSMMPGSIVGGNVRIGNRVYMGSCSNIREGINICDDVVIGMNAAVVRDITEPGTYVGVPAKKIIYNL